MSERPVRVAIVDSGINPGHPHIGRVAGGVTITADGVAVQGFPDGLGHGTAVAAAIRERAPAADLLAVKVFEGQLSTTVGRLVAAIDWAVAARADLINLSLGTTHPDHRPALEAAVGRAVAQGCVIVAAGTHRGVEHLPGTLDGVVRVELDWHCPRMSVEVGKDEAGCPVCRASGYPRPIPGVPPERNLKGISFAVANVTGVVAARATAGSGMTAHDAVALLGPT